MLTGPSLWTDLYGRWIANAATTDRSGKGDEIILQAGVAALQQPLYSFIVVHFGSVDDAGHRHGVHALTHAQAVAWCDWALSQLLAHVGRYTAVLIVADHGATANGGHAGPELIVRDTPLVTWGPGMPRGALGTLRQRDAQPRVASDGARTDASFSPVSDLPLVSEALLLWWQPSPWPVACGYGQRSPRVPPCGTRRRSATALYG